MLINGLNKFVAKSGMTEVDKLTRTAAGVSKSEATNQDRKYHAARSQSKSHSMREKELVRPAVIPTLACRVM